MGNSQIGSVLNMKLSIVISTRNAASTLDMCLSSIEHQDCRNQEIIIADNYSTDNTREIGLRHGAFVMTCGPKPPNNDYFTGPIQKRLGSLRASGDFIFLMDADMILERGLISECIHLMLEGAHAVAVPEVSFGEGFWASCRVAERKCYFEPDIADEAIQACRFFERSTFKSIGGWDGVVGVFDDWDLTARLRSQGHNIVRAQRRIFHNEGQLTLRNIVVKKYRMGKVAYFSKYISLGGKSVETISSQLTPLRIVRLMGKLPRVSKRPAIVFGVALMKICEGVAFLAGAFQRPKNYELELK